MEALCGLRRGHRGDGVAHRDTGWAQCRFRPARAHSQVARDRRPPSARAFPPLLLFIRNRLDLPAAHLAAGPALRHALHGAPRRRRRGGGLARGPRRDGQPRPAPRGAGSAGTGAGVVEPLQRDPRSRDALHRRLGRERGRCGGFRAGRGASVVRGGAAGGGSPTGHRGGAGGGTVRARHRPGDGA